MSLAIPADNLWAFAAVWLALATGAAFLSRRVGLAAALVEILLGVLAGNLIGLRSNAWVDFIAGFGSIMLTFLAGAEIEPTVPAPAAAAGGGHRRHLVRRAIPGRDGLRTFRRALDLGCLKRSPAIAMVDDFRCVVYAVMVESRLGRHPTSGQLILAACFITGSRKPSSRWSAVRKLQRDGWRPSSSRSSSRSSSCPRFLPAVFSRTERLGK